MKSLLMPVIISQLLFAAAATSPPNNSDGSAGLPPSLFEYLGIASSKSVGFDLHTVFGLATRDGGSVAVGTGLKLEDADELFNGVAIKLGRCSSYDAQFQILPASSPDPAGCGVQWIFTIKSSVSSKSAQLLWAAESPDTEYVLVAGLVWESGAYSRYLAKLNVTDGTKIWDVTLPYGEATRAGDNVLSVRTLHAGFESIAFTSDGGLVASGFVGATLEPHFKSSGQVEDGRPNVVKWSATQVAAASAPDLPAWSYTCKHTEDAYVGSAKVIREDSSSGSIIALVGTGATLVYLNASGVELSVGSFEEHGQASDFAVVPGGVMLSGLLGYDSTIVCPKGCHYVQGRISFIAANATALRTTLAPAIRLERKWSKSYGNPPGGKYQFAGLPKGADELVYNECWGIQPTLNAASGRVDGAVMACGTGIEGCDTPGLTPSLKEECKHDPRTTWRAMTISVDLEGALRWRRIDSYKPAEDSRVGTSAAEYVFLQSDGAPVLVTDEGFGAGWVVLK